MISRLILLKKYHKGAERYFIKNILGFETPKDLENFEKQPFNLIFRFKMKKTTSIERQDHEMIKQKMKLFIDSKNEAASDIDLITTHLTEVTFKVPADKIRQFIDKGYFYLPELPALSLSYSGGCQLYLQDHKGKEHALSEINLSIPTTINGFHIDSKPADSTTYYTSAPLYFEPKIASDELYWRFSEQELRQPPGTIPVYSYYDSPPGFHVIMKNFRPDEHIALVSRTLDDNQIPSYTFIPPSVIQNQLTTDKKIDFLNVADQLVLSGYPHPRYNKFFLPLPSLFSGHHDFKMIQTIKGKESCIKPFQNPTKIFEIHTDREARLAWANHQSSTQEKSMEAISNEAGKTDCFIKQVEHHPLRFEHNSSKDVLGQGTIRRNVDWDGHFIHLSSTSPYNIPKPITLYEALPKELQIKFYNKEFCLIQYNASKTVPKLSNHPDAKPGYITFNGTTLEPGRIHRNFSSLDDLTKSNIHGEHGGSYYVLAACTPEYMKGDYTQPRPEIWTVFTEGKSWGSLRGPQGKPVNFPSLINY